MKPLDRLSEYLGAVERRMRLLALTRGAAVTAAAALALTVVLVLIVNYFAFSSRSVLGARVLLFLGLGLALAAAIVVPVIRLNRRRAARAAEKRYPQFQERLLTFTERVEQNPSDPFLELLADDTLAVARDAEPRKVTRNSWILSFSSAAVCAAGVLIWLGLWGPGFLGYGTSLLWGGLPKGDLKPFYAIQVDPGNRTVRKRADQLITATLSGFAAPKVRFFAKYASASQWEQAEMRSAPGGSSYQFLIAGVPETLDYYVEAGGVHSPTYKLNVVDLPSVKNIKITYHYPAWADMKDLVENPGGDLRAVEGTTAEVAIQTDRPLSTGALLLDDGSKLLLRQAADGLLAASVPIQKDGTYHIAAVEGGEDVRLSEDYFIEAQKDEPPEVRIIRPGRDFRATPIEEVTVAVEAKDDFALKGVELHYSVNGGAEKTVGMLPEKNAKTAAGSTVISLEDFKVEPGDIVSLYATAKDARKTTTTDMFFIEAQPFERNYTQSQDGGGGGGGGGGGDDANQQNQISQRQKEIITATWNELKGRGARGTEADNAAFLSSVQSKLRDQAQSLANRMKSRQIEEAGESFKSFIDDMESAVKAMAPAADKLKGAKWQDAVTPEQEALRYLLRAEATFRDIQVAFGRQGGGGGGGGGGQNGAARDLQGLFDLELDTEKNQYESARANQTADQQQKAIDEALQKLEQLAKRQQELADQQQQKTQQQISEQRYQQEMLRREAEQLQKELQQATQLQRSTPQQGQGQQQGGQQQGGQQQGQQSGQGGGQGGQQQSGQQGGKQQGAQQAGQQQGSQSGQPQNGQNQTNRLGQMGLRGADQQHMQDMLNSLNQALQDMGKAASSQQAGTPQSQADARRAAEALQQATRDLGGIRTAQSKNQVEDLARQAEDLAKKQQDFEGEMRKAFGPQSQGTTREQANQLATQKEGEVADLKKLESGMQTAARDLQATQRQASVKMREALSQIQQQEMERDMQRNADFIKRGLGEYAVMSEPNFTQGLNEVRDQLKQMQQAMAAGRDPKDNQQDKVTQQGLANLEAFRQMMQQQAGGRGQPGRGQQQGGQQQGGRAQGGQQQGGQQQGGQQAGTQAGQGGQQQGGQQQGGQQPGQQAGPGGQSNQGGNPQSGSLGPGGNGGGFNGGAGNWGGNWGGPGTVNPQARINGPIDAPDFQTQYRNTMQSLQQMQQQFRNDPAAARDIGALIQQMRQMDPYTYANDPMLAQRIQAAVIAGAEQVEMELRRKVDEAAGANVRSPGSAKVPPGYQDATAEYFKKLSKSK